MADRLAQYLLGNTRFRVAYGDLTRVPAEVLVSSDDNYLSMGGGVSMALLQAGGQEIAEHARKHLPLRQGEVAVTTAGRLPARFIFHGVTIDHDRMLHPDADTIHSIVVRCLELAEALRIRQIAFPALGSGVGRFPFQRSADVMVRNIADHLGGTTQLEEVTLALWGRPGVQQDDLNLFYERAVGVASLFTQSRRLQSALEELETLLPRGAGPTLRRRFDELLAELTEAGSTLREDVDTVEDMTEVERRSGLGSIAQTVVDLTAPTGEVDRWATGESEALALRTRVEGLSAQLNINYANLNRLQVEEARYGGVGVPLILTNQIAEIEATIERKTRELADAKAASAAAFTTARA